VWLWLAHCLHATWSAVISYTQHCQFDRKWNDATIACRGLILDTNGCVVARPFGKFFNFGEPSPIVVPVNEPFVVRAGLTLDCVWSSN
jgi:hypothetical protein